MSRPNKQQHKPEREYKDPKPKQIRELRRQNQQLRRENARLRRQLQRTASVVADDVEFEEPPKPVVPESTSPKCPECASELESMSLGPKVFLVCKTCKWRKAQ